MTMPPDDGAGEATPSPRDPLLLPGREKPLRGSDWRPEQAFEALPDTSETEPGRLSAGAGEPPLPSPSDDIPGASPGPATGEPPELGEFGAPAPPLASPPPPAPPLRYYPPPEVPPAEPYPMRFEIAYPERLSRWKTFFRFVLLLPPMVFAYLLIGLLYAGLVAGWTTVFWRKKYPLWLFGGVGGAFGFLARLGAYQYLLTDKFPSFSRDDSPVLLEFDAPPQGALSRWRVFWWKLVLLVPHFIVLYFLALALSVVTFLAWFGIMFTGNYPRGMFAFAVGVQRWQWRVASYFASFNDRYPPYALSANAGPASNGAVVGSGVGGGLVFGGLVAAIVVGIVVAATRSPHTEDVTYAQLQQGRGNVTVVYHDFEGDLSLTITRVTDPGDELATVLPPGRGERLIVFEWAVFNPIGAKQRTIEADASELKYLNHGTTSTRTAEFVTVGSRAAPETIGDGGTTRVRAVFVVPDTAQPMELRFDFGGGFGRTVRYRFH